MSIRSFFYTNYPQQYGIFLNIKERLLLPFKFFFFYLGFNIFFGNKDQDKWVIKEVFNFKKNGYFVDLAATDGLHENNTYFLEKRLNWRGVCVEPNISDFKKLEKIRKAKCYSEIISGKKSNVEYLINGGVGGIIGSGYDNNMRKRGNLINKSRKNNKIQKRKTTTLEEILKKAKAPKTIDYLSLDVEGAEYQVLRKFPFKKYKFLCMTIERPSSELNKIIFKNGYKFVRNFKVDGFYIHKSLTNQNKIKFEKFYQIGKKKW